MTMNNRCDNCKKKTVITVAIQNVSLVFPHPLDPTMIVKGNPKSITCSSSSGLKARTPRMASLLMEAIDSFIRYCVPRQNRC